MNNIDLMTAILNTGFTEFDGLEGTPVYTAWIACRLIQLAIVLKDDVGPECVAYTAETLMMVPPPYLDWALTRARRECKTFPKPVEVFDFLKEIPGFTMPGVTGGNQDD